MHLHVLYEDNHLLALVKPAGLIMMGAEAGLPSLLTYAKEYIRAKYNKPGNVYLGAMSRLDAPVSGVALLARTSKAAARLSEQFRTHRVEKIYWAVVEGRIEPPAAECCNWIAADERHRRMHVVGPKSPGARECRLSYSRKALLGGGGGEGSLLEIQLETGRKHQIRLQLSARGFPVWGDRKYGSRQPFPIGIALHARRLVVQHPVRQVPIELEAPLPASWQKLGLPAELRSG